MTLPVKTIRFLWRGFIASVFVLAAYLLHLPPVWGQQKAPAIAVQTASPVPYDPLGPIPSPLDQKMVKLTYEPNASINVFALAGQLVHIKLAPDEQIVTIQLSDPIRWKVERVEEDGLAPRLFIKPTQVGIATTMTVVTAIPSIGGGRNYEMLLQSVPEGGRYFRQLSFDYPDIREREAKAKRAVQAKALAEQSRLEAQELTPPLGLESITWAYDIEGKAPFKPDVVFDDGRFTYIRIPPSAQEWPAVFLLNGKELQYVQVVRKGELLVVQRLVPALLLKINDAEVRIYRKDSRPRGWFGG